MMPLTAFSFISHVVLLIFNGAGFSPCREKTFHCGYFVSSTGEFCVSHARTPAPVEDVFGAWLLFQHLYGIGQASGCEPLHEAVSLAAGRDRGDPHVLGRPERTQKQCFGTCLHNNQILTPSVVSQESVSCGERSTNFPCARHTADSTPSLVDYALDDPRATLVFPLQWSHSAQSNRWAKVWRLVSASITGTISGISLTQFGRHAIC